MRIDIRWWANYLDKNKLLGSYDRVSIRGETLVLIPEGI